MELWSRWPQRERPMDESADKRWFSKSFLFQMAEIDGEMERVFRDKAKLERIRTDRNYVGEPQVIQRVFAIIKRDPKNTPLLREIERAERETVAFLSGAPDAPTLEDMRAYWNNYAQAYIAELEQRDTFGRKEADL